MKNLILILVSVASLAWAQDVSLERGDDSAPNNKIGLGKNVEGQPNLPGSYFGAHVNEDKSGPQDACPNCGPSVQLPQENPSELNADLSAPGKSPGEGTSGSGGEQK